MSIDFSPMQTSEVAPTASNWRSVVLKSVAFGGGFALVAVLSMAVLYWWSERPKPWTDTAITAKPTELSMQIIGEEERFRFRYALTNNTGRDYILPRPGAVALMRVLPADSSLEKVQSAEWDSETRIPPKQTINVIFKVTYDLAEFNTSAAELAKGPGDSNFNRFTLLRMLDIKSFEFFDYSAKFRIVMPSDWQGAPM
jgi:hypothetical protein